MNLEIEITTVVDTIPIIKISAYAKGSSKSKEMYLMLDDGQLIELVKKHDVELIKEFDLSNISITGQINLSEVSEIVIDSLNDSFSKTVKKENITTDGSDELKVCSDCGVQAERKGAKFCFHCGAKF